MITPTWTRALLLLSFLTAGCWCDGNVHQPMPLPSIPRPRPDDCKPGLPEFFCATDHLFAWCEDARYVHTCPPGLLCNTKLPFLCMQPPEGYSTLTPELTTTENPGDVEEIDNDSWDVAATPPPSCLKAGRFPDAHDCNVFHLCMADSNGNLTHQVVSCPTGSHYAVSLGKCAIPERARCDTQTQSFTCTNSGRIPDPTDCSKFIVCYPEGLWRRYSCPIGSYFDSETSKCSLTESVCIKGGHSDYICTNRGLFSHSNDCRKFYYCIPHQDNFVQGLAVCPKSSVFNPTTSRCTLNTKVCDSVTKFCRGRRHTRYPDPESCDSFVVCSGNQSVGYSCPYGSYYSAPLMRCVRDSKSTCSRSVLPCKQAGRFPDPSVQCKGFYVCLWRPGGWVTQRYMCPDTSIFDPITGACSLNSNIGCNGTIKNV